MHFRKTRTERRSLSPTKLIAALILFLPLAVVTAFADDNQSDSGHASTLEAAKAAGRLKSTYLASSAKSMQTDVSPDGEAKPQPRLAFFRKTIDPILKQVCVQCHGPDAQEGNIRIDELNPDLLHGDDVNWWLEVLAVLSNGEMPPPDDVELSNADRARIIEWLSSEIQVASTVRRAEEGHSSFRRMTRYEYNYALQDLLGLPYDFAKDLPPEPASEDGFQNSSEMLQMSATQFESYREISGNALKKATVFGDRPLPVFWGVTMETASEKMWAKHDEDITRLKKQLENDPEKLKQELERRAARGQRRPGGAHFLNLDTGEAVQASWRYNGASYAFEPTTTRPEVPKHSPHVAVIPARQKLIVELGNRVPDTGTLRVRVRASRTSVEGSGVPSLSLEFGWQASNNSDASVRISDHDIVIDASPDNPKFYQWDVPLSEIYPRNPIRKTGTMGETPSPSEYVRLLNSSLSQADIQIYYVEVTAPVYEQWPPASHTRIFLDSASEADESVYARDVLTRFIRRAWRRSVTSSEVDQKLALFAQFRSSSNNFQEAMIEVLATVLASPKFLYLVQDVPSPEQGDRTLSDDELATRLSIFLWCSTPDQELMDLAAEGRLSTRDVLIRQTERMLADPRSQRFSEHFVRQWLGMELLDFLSVDRKAYPQFDSVLKEAMQDEPVAFFHELLQNNGSVIDFLHSDYTMANERLARHYGISDVYGNDFRRVSLRPEDQRGGLLTQAGLLAMNSDGKDSHPLKRGIWLLESLLNDPPPPPPPAVPEIDLADPEIAKLTLKQRIENHRNHAACMSCHAKIDPWGIAFENFDAVGSWRTQINGEVVDAASLLFNKQKLDGIDGLKRFLLTSRQDQFTRAITHKLTTYALGRPLTFGDRSSVDQITADVRNQGDGLATLVTSIVTSNLFRSK